MTETTLESAHIDLQALTHDTIDDLITRIAERTGPSDLVADFAEPLVVTINAQLLGIPNDAVVRLKQLTDSFSNFLGAVAGQSIIKVARRAFREVTEALSYFEELARQRYEKPTNDLLSQLVELCNKSDDVPSGNSATRGEILGLFGELLFAGQETSINLIGNCMWHLLSNPDELSFMRSSPRDYGSGAIEETLRISSPVQITSRVAKADIVLGGTTISAGQNIAVCLGAANLDPEQFDMPNEFRISRSPNRHIAFGHGSHFCLGSSLARATGKMAVASLVERFPSIRLEYANPKWKSSPTYRGLQTLTVRIR